MKNFRIDWTDDRFEDYENEDEWIDAYPDCPCPGCGMPGVTSGVVCRNCGCEGYTIAENG
ncbi:MAG: hypothetical protein ACOH5I_26275 [Oligoflexus sp.]